MLITFPFAWSKLDVRAFTDTTKSLDAHPGTSTETGTGTGSDGQFTTTLDDASDGDIVERGSETDPLLAQSING